MEASTFQAGGQVSLDGKPLWQPMNLVFPSAFMLAPDTIGVLWYDFFLKSEEGSQLRNQRILRASLYTVSKRQWRPLTVAAPDLDLLTYRLNASTLWHEDKLLLLGGNDFSETSSGGFPVTQLRFQ